MQSIRSLAYFIGFCGALSAVTAAESVFRSGPEHVALLELYTSEGCSSCPPAERWLGELRQDAGLWRRFVPVAFHVNYWDHLGWRDALASKAFTERQHSYAAAWRANSVYTPGFVRNGAEWRPREGRDLMKPDTADAGLLTLTWLPDRQVARVSYIPATTAPAAKTMAALDANIALLGGGIVTNVRKGENAGRELRHEFVALRLESVPLERDATGMWSAEVALPARTDVTASRRALAAWVTPRGELKPVQATGGWLE